MKNRRNYYRILHVQADAPTAIIKASYRALMQKLRMHPDLGGDDWNAALLNEAYATLSNPEQRAAYDREWQHRPAGPGTAAERAGDTPPGKANPPPGTSGSRPDDSRCPFCQTRHPPDFLYHQPADCPGCGAPLQRANHPGLSSSLQRTIQRTKHTGPLRFYTAREDLAGSPGTLRDLSLTGLQFACPSQLAINQVIRIESDVLAATVRITRCLKDEAGRGYQVGGAFLTLRFHASRGTFVSENA